MDSGGQNFLFVSNFYEKSKYFRGFWGYRFAINFLEVLLLLLFGLWVCGGFLGGGEVVSGREYYYFYPVLLLGISVDVKASNLED